MKKLIFIISLFFVSVPVYARVSTCSNGINPYRCGTTWDANIDIGAGGRINGDSSILIRARAGLMFVKEPLYLSVGPTVSVYSESFAFGIQGELIHLYTGLWGAAETLVDNDANLGISLSTGWSLFGFEYQYRNDHMFFGKVRIPIGMIALIF